MPSWYAGANSTGLSGSDNTGWAFTVPPTPAYIQGAPTNVAVTAGTLAPSLAGVTALDTLVLTVINATQTSGQAASAVSGGGATWALAGTFPGTVGVVDVWIGTAAAAGTATLSVTLNGSVPTAGCQLDEWSGLSGAVETSGTASGTSTAPALTIAPLQNRDVVIVVSDAATETASPGAPWTLLAGPTTASTQKNGIAYQIASYTAAQTATWTTLSSAWTTLGVVLAALTSAPLTCTGSGKGTSAVSLTETPTLTATAAGKGTSTATATQVAGLTVTATGNGTAAATVTQKAALTATALGQGGMAVVLTLLFVAQPAIGPLLAQQRVLLLLAPGPRPPTLVAQER
jgi:hypothetical protein